MKQKISDTMEKTLLEFIEDASLSTFESSKPFGRIKRNMDIDDYDNNMEDRAEPGLIESFIKRARNFASSLIKLHPKKKILPLTPESFKQRVLTFFGLKENIKDKKIITIQIYEMFWNSVDRTITVLKKCELEEINLKFYKKSFSEKNNLFTPLDSNDPFFPFYNFLINLSEFDVKREDYNKLTSNDKLSDQPFIKMLLRSFENFLDSYKDDFDKEQKIVVKSGRKTLTDREKRVIHNLLFEHVLSVRKLFDFSDCQDSFKQQMMKIDELIEQTQKKIEHLNAEWGMCPNNPRIEKYKIEGEDLLLPNERPIFFWRPELNYTPRLIKNEKICKENVFKKSKKKIDRKTFNCVLVPEKTDESLFNEYTNEDYLDYLNSESDIASTENKTGNIEFKHDANYYPISTETTFGNYSNIQDQSGQLEPLNKTTQINSAHKCAAFSVPMLGVCDISFLIFLIIFTCLIVSILFITKKILKQRSEKKKSLNFEREENNILADENIEVISFL
jgi:hypothetical protein